MARGFERQLRALSWSLMNVPVGQEGVISDITCVPARTTERGLGSRVYPEGGGSGFREVVELARRIVL